MSAPPRVSETITRDSLVRWSDGRYRSVARLSRVAIPCRGSRHDARLFRRYATGPLSPAAGALQEARMLGLGRALGCSAGIASRSAESNLKNSQDKEECGSNSQKDSGEGSAVAVATRTQWAAQVSAAARWAAQVSAAARWAAQVSAAAQWAAQVSAAAQWAAQVSAAAAALEGSLGSEHAH